MKVCEGIWTYEYQECKIISRKRKAEQKETCVRR